MAYNDPISKSGTWIPNVQINGSSTGITYGAQNGFYYQIGQVVFLGCIVVLTSKGVSSGNVTISNLPINTGPNSIGAIAITDFQGWTLASYTEMALYFANANSAVANFVASGSGQTTVNIANTQITNTFSFVMYGFYLIN